MTEVPKIEKGKIYTFEDYRSWPESFRCEIIDGVAYVKSTPFVKHQRTSGNLLLVICNFLDRKKHVFLPGPLEVKLTTINGLDTVVEPDLLIICDKSKLNERGCHGAPEIIIEITSHETAILDCFTKYRKYLNEGVKEYWIVDPETESINLCILNGDSYITKIFTKDDVLHSQLLKGFELKLSEVFEQI